MGYATLQARAAALLEARRELERRKGSGLIAPPPFSAFQQKYYHDPAGFVRDCFKWRENEGAASYQSDFLSKITPFCKASIRGPRGLGKTALNSWLVLWFALTRDNAPDGMDWKIITTAGSWRQLDKFLWPEIHKWVHRLDWSVIGRAPARRDSEELSMSLRFSTGEAIAVASSNSDLVEGAHADKIMLLLDEAKAIPEAVWDALEGSFSSNIAESGREAIVVATSTPGPTEGRFYEIHQKTPGLEDWIVQHVTLEQCIAEKRVNPKWAEARRLHWGEASPLYKNQVLGEFASGRASGIIPLEWVEAAVERWYIWKGKGHPGRVTSYGVDVSGGNEDLDRTVIAVCVDGMKILDVYPLSFKSQGTALMETAGQVKRLQDQYLGGVAVIDSIGIGAGTIARLNEMHYPTIPFNASYATSLTDMSGSLRFTNWRAAGWWLLREMLDPHNGFDICLPPDKEGTYLMPDLIAPQSVITSSGAMAVESKKDIRKRIGRSPDYADAVIQAICGPVLWNNMQSETVSQVTPVTFDMPIGNY